ncbi:MAG: AzlD domain-containing protein [Erysipelotrichaceae bacterium]|nr:AzlD domain-containing protein [Erysipelotrichaceae bacterium]
MNNWYVFIAIVISAICTFGMRALPFLISDRMKIKSQKLEFLGRILPPAIMAVLLVYCLKDVPSDFIGIGIAKLAGVLVTGISYIWKNNSFLSIILGTLCYMLLI